MRNLILKRLQSIRRARREVAGVTFCARTFQKPAHYFCYCPTGPSRKAGREAPPRGVFVAWCNVGTFVRLCFGVSCDICAGTFLLCDRGRGVAVVVTSWLWLCRVRRGRGCRVLDVTPAVPCPGRRGRRCGARRICVAVVWLRHADEC